MEKDGFIYTIAAKGCFVAPKNVELLREENLKRIESYKEQYGIIRCSGSDLEAIEKLFEDIYRGCILCCVN